MSQWTALILFLTVFHILYGGVHYYIFQKIKAAFNLTTFKTFLFLMFIIAMIFTPLLTRFTVKYGMESYSRLLAFTGYTWMGFVLLLFTFLILTDLSRLLVFISGFLVKRDLFGLIPQPRYQFLFPFILALLISTFAFQEARTIRTEKIIIKTAKIPRDLAKITIVQISDLHLGLIVREQRLRGIIEMITRINPDLLVSTGDLLDEQINNLQECGLLLKEVNPRYGKYAVLGNHEFYAGIPRVLKFLDEAGFSVLRGGEAKSIGVINIAGFDDPAGRRFGLSQEISESEFLKSLPRDRFTILLKHRPLVDKHSLGLFDLQLSGHTHKGQFFPFTIFTHYIYPIDSGFLRLTKTSSIYVNRGIGTWGPPFRLFSPPELTVVELYPE